MIIIFLFDCLKLILPIDLQDEHQRQTNKNDPFWLTNLERVKQIWIWVESYPRLKNIELQIIENTFSREYVTTRRGEYQVSSTSQLAKLACW